MDELQNLYDRTYETLLIENRASSYIRREPQELSTERASGVKEFRATETGESPVKPRFCHTVTIEELPDEADDEPWISTQRSVLQADGPILEEVDPPSDADGGPNSAPEQAAASDGQETVNVVDVPLRRRFPPGYSARGISVLLIRGRVNQTDERDIDLRLDSGADITLISEDFYYSLKSPPRLQQGPRMQLWQLVEKSASLPGYVYLNIFVLADNAGTGWKIQAQDVEKLAKRPSLRRSVAQEASFVRVKASRRRAAERRRAARVETRASTEIRLAEDVVVPASSVVNAGVLFRGDRDPEWLVEKALIHVLDDQYLAIPNCLMNGQELKVPLSNPGDVPVKAAKGTLLGYVQDPAVFFDRPKDVKQLEEMVEYATWVATLATAFPEGVGHPTTEGEPLSEQGVAQKAYSTGANPRATAFGIPPDEPRPTDEENWGPKTAEVPDPTVYPSEQMRDIIDVGDLPEELAEKAWAMLEKRQKAFGFDGRLGNLATKVRICTEEGLQPIAVPMYGTSPKTKAVIEEQLAKWFEQGVIEPSKSPWSAPVVIAYWNGKPRFCVDYRKLNAHTIRDEFPIPRQSEILVALSGAQVLSSLDALAGFTQMEFEESEREKTAFRTHLGLFQFIRMPFGLTNGPSIFQRTMQTILAPFLWLFCLVYIDDIVVYSKTYEEHIEHLNQVLGACEKAGLTLSPAKCHLFYASVLLLGHKVSRLGLSTHEEKVKAILELARPTNRHQLQTFLGMAGYFSAFIPYYALVATPLFALLKKNARWRWGPTEDHAFQELKRALQASPVLGHPMEGRPYRLYTDASGEALGCALQQVQPIDMRDLHGTKHYDRLKAAHDEKKDVPKLVTTLAAALEDCKFLDHWGEKFETSVVHVERVIGYWSRTFKPAERNYSVTEREALAAKEGLVKFQPFIEGEKIALVTDHAALQWAHTYENSNRRLAAWGAVFSAFKPGLAICHRPGRVHSNVDPLSRLPRDPKTGIARPPPEHQSPARDSTVAIKPDNGPAAAAEKAALLEPKAVFWSEHQLSAPHVRTVLAVTRAQARRKKGQEPEEVVSFRKGRPSVKADDSSKPARPENDEPPKGFEADERDPHEKAEAWREANPPPPPTLLAHISESKKEQFRQAYPKDPFFAGRLQEAAKLVDSWYPGQRFFLDHDGLLFFRDADFQPRLCVPKDLRNEVLRSVHESPFETAHAGTDRSIQALSRTYYWHRMAKDICAFCESCDVCQKVKTRNFVKYGLLQPNPVPNRPFETISMDLVTGLPMSGGFNAIWVVVDRLSKLILLIATTTGLNTTEFARLFVKHAPDHVALL
ncbi:polyprotein [Phanerochaete sordida]|uniref:Polyprotein n=1 Tax=Phanerochaete sordida TaxID=48140 RepID=A0A9P3GS82_9APHY|nr:polyprotein [Phanerochaete sordida]